MGAILLDIEGTVSDKRFVAETLFPFARKRIKAFMRDHARDGEVAAAASLMRAKMGRPDAGPDEIGAELEHWIDADKKEEPLKSLQGLIWKEGYDSGELVSHIYADVPPALERWRKAGKRIAIFSSGSVGAQKLLFAHTSIGDLTPYFSGYFDLSTGPKFEAASYVKIAKALDHQPSDIHFYSDAPREVEAALAAGLVATLVERDGPIEASPSFRRIQDFTGE
ncbi:MAG: acireductone synthase [Alphaproteobacteria bacterium]